MDVKKFAKDAFQTAQGMCWGLEDFVSETWEKFKNSGRAKVALGAGLGIGVPMGATILFLAYPRPAISQESEDVICGYPANTDPALLNLLNRILESKEYSFKLKVKPGETITDAINGFATSFADGAEVFISDAVSFLTALGYDLNREYTSECFVPICYSGEGCNPQELITRASQEPVVAEAAPPAPVPMPVETTETQQVTPEAGITETAANQAPTVSAGADLEGIVNKKIKITAEGNDPDGDPIKYTWKLTGYPIGTKVELNGADTAPVSFTPDLPGRYLLEVTANDGRGGITNDYVVVKVKKADFDPLKYGMNPAAIFNLGLGMHLGMKGGELKPYAFHVEGGPLFGFAKRIDNDNIEIKDPMETLIDTISLEKIRETDDSGYYADAFAKVGDMTLLTFNVRGMTQQGNFSIDGQDVSDYKRDDVSVQLGVRRGIYSLPGKFLITGDLFLGYVGMNDEANDEFGSTSSSTEMFGIGGGVNAAFRIPIGDFQMIPGLGAAYHYYSGEDDDMHSLIVARGGVYDIRWSEFFGIGFDYTYRIGEGVISDKELETNTELHRIAMEMNFGRNRLVGAGFGYIINGTYEEGLPGDVLSRDADVTGFDASLIGRYPMRWGNVGLRAGYELKRIDFNDGMGDLEESIGNVGIFVEF